VSATGRPLVRARERAVGWVSDCAAALGDELGKAAGASGLPIGEGMADAAKAAAGADDTTVAAANGSAVGTANGLACAGAASSAWSACSACAGGGTAKGSGATDTGRRPRGAAFAASAAVRLPIDPVPTTVSSSSS
jgi:hypothetical protein